MTLSQVTGQLTSGTVALESNAVLFWGGKNQARVHCSDLSTHRPFLSPGAGKVVHQLATIMVPRYSEPPQSLPIAAAFRVGDIVGVSRDIDPPNSKPMQLRIQGVADSPGSINLTVRHPDE
jgi:hypothetical protein